MRVFMYVYVCKSSAYVCKYSIRVSATSAQRLTSRISSNVTSPAVPPYSSTTIAKCSLIRKRVKKSGGGGEGGKRKRCG